MADYNKELLTIGRGGYGKIYLAKNKKDKKEYAIKLISKAKMKSLNVSPSVIRREIDIHIRIFHPHIIRLISFKEDVNSFYLAMEYASNGTLYNLIQRKKGLPEEVAFNYFIQVASAIQFLHSNGYAHRDIKPENILIDENGEIKLCDFGWCVNVAKGERITFCGTYEYMAPEMINDEYYDMGIDVWSLGILLYEMIHGYSPFRAKEGANAMEKIFHNIKSNNYTINKNISEECIDLIHKLLTIDNKKRIKIDELFLHPWVKNKEQKYFPTFSRMGQDNYKPKTTINNNINQYDNTNKSNNNPNMHNNNNDIMVSKHIKNKSYCFVYNKNNSNNNGIYFSQGPINCKKSNNNIPASEKVIRKERKIMSPNVDKKEIISNNNNFILSVNSKKRDIKLPKVNRKDTNTKISNHNVESYDLKEIKERLKHREKVENKSFSLGKIEEKKLNLNFRDKKNINLNQSNYDLDAKLQKIKEQQKILGYSLKKIEDCKKREESQKNCNESQKTKSSCNFGSKIGSLGGYNSFVIPYSVRKEKNFPIINKLKNEHNSFRYNLLEKIRQKRPKSYQNIFSLESHDNKRRYNNKDKKKTKNIDIDENINYKNININGDLGTSKDNFKRFRKMVVHIRKRNNIPSNTEHNFYKVNNNIFKKINENKIKFSDNDKKNIHHSSKSIQNVFYNTFYNCLFSNNMRSDNSNKNRNKSKSISTEKNYSHIKEYKNKESAKNIKEYNYNRKNGIKIQYLNKENMHNNSEKMNNGEKRNYINMNSCRYRTQNQINSKVITI